MPRRAAFGAARHGGVAREPANAITVAFLGFKGTRASPPLCGPHVHTPRPSYAVSPRGGRLCDDDRVPPTPPSPHPPHLHPQREAWNALVDDAKRAVWQVRSDNAKKLQAFCEGISGLREAESVLSAVVAPEKSEHMEVCGEGGGAHGAR